MIRIQAIHAEEARARRWSEVDLEAGTVVLGAPLFGSRGTSNGGQS